MQDAADGSGGGAGGGMSPGHMLHIARQQLGVSLDEAARAANLTRRIVDALEADDFGKLGQPVYVRGYYRRYAKVVSCDVTQVLAAYEKLNELPSPVPEIHQRPSIPYGQSASVWPARMPWIFAGLGLVLIVLWAWSRVETAPQPPAATPVSADDVAPAAPSRAPLPTLADETAARRPVAVDFSQLGSAPTDDATLSSGPAAEETPRPGSSTPGVPPNQLDIWVGPEPAWIEVLDAADNRLAYRTADPGEHLSLRGDPPYRLNLGRAHTLRLHYGGEEKNLQPLLDSASRARGTITGTGELIGR